MDQTFEQIRQKKLLAHYPVKSANNDNQTLGVDLNKRSVDVIANTYLFMDNDGDVLIPGCAKRSIDQRGPASTACGKIKHQQDHELDTEHAVGIPESIEEIKTSISYNGQNFDAFVLKCSSRIPRSRKGDDHLINYQSGLYDQHSIGFRYIDLQLAMPSGDTNESKLWAEYLPQLINKEDAINAGYFWAVKEIALWEYSVVSFGANCLTPYIGSKAQTKQAMTLKLFNRLDLLSKQLTAGQQSDEMIKTFEMQIMQIKQMIEELNEAPEIDTHKIDPSTKGIDYVNIISNLKF